MRFVLIFLLQPGRGESRGESRGEFRGDSTPGRRHGPPHRKQKNPETPGSQDPKRPYRPRGRGHHQKKNETSTHKSETPPLPPPPPKELPKRVEEPVAIKPHHNAHIVENKPSPLIAPSYSRNFAPLIPKTPSYSFVTLNRPTARGSKGCDAPIEEKWKIPQSTKNIAAIHHYPWIINRDLLTRDLSTRSFSRNFLRFQPT